MKPQDIIFLIVLITLLYKRNASWMAISGLALLLFSIVLFALQIFFTAQRFVMYAAVFLLISCFFQMLELRKHDRIKK